MNRESRFTWLRRAAAEFIVIVVGVLVALGVDGWREDRIEYRRETVYLERLHSDLIKGQAELLDNGLDHLRGASANMRRVSDFLRYGDPAPVDTASFVAALYGATRSLHLRLNEGYPNTTFEELWSTGGFLLIQDGKLRAAIISHYSGVESTGLQLDLQPRGYRDMIRGLLPGDLQETIREACELREPEFTCTYEFGRFDPKEFLRGLQGNPEVSEALALSLQQTVISIPYIEQLVSGLEELIGLVEEALIERGVRVP